MLFLNIVENACVCSQKKMLDAPNRSSVRIARNWQSDTVRRERRAKHGGAGGLPKTGPDSVWLAVLGVEMGRIVDRPKTRELLPETI